MIGHGPIRRWRLVFLIASSLMTVACGSQDEPSASPGASGVATRAAPSGSGVAGGCDFMTIAQASEALGAPIDTATPLPDALGCTYEVTGSPTLIGYQFADEAYWTEAKKAYDADIDLGDEAFYVTDAGFTTLVVREGSTYFSVVVHIPSSSGKSAVEVGSAVAGYVLAALP